MKKQTLTLIAASLVFNLRTHAAVHGKPVIHEPEQLHSSTAKVFDGVRTELGKEYTTQPFIMPAPDPKTGLVTLSERVTKLGEWKEPGYRNCWSGASSVGSYMGVVSNWTSGRYCSWVPPRKVQEFERVSTYLIPDTPDKKYRKQYAHYKGTQGAKIGAFLGSGAGFLGAFVSAFFTTNLIGLAGLVLAGLVLGISVGYRKGATKAWKTPDVFTETEKFRKERWAVNSPEDVIPTYS